jgi:hypothetical protein
MTRRSKFVLTISKRALAKAVSLRGRLRANNRRGDGENKERNNGAQERNLSIGITRKQSRTVFETRNGNFIIFVLCLGALWHPYPRCHPLSCSRPCQ